MTPEAAGVNRHLTKEGFMARDAIVEAMVSQDTKNEAEKLCSRWGVSLSDAINDFLVKCVERGELPFEATFGGNGPYGYPKPMDPKDVKVRIVCKVDEHGRTVLPAEEYCEEDDVYDELYPAPFASEAEACDFADAAARDVIDGRRVNQVPFS